MSDIEQLIQRIGQAKAFIDNGLCRVGPDLSANHRVEALLAGCASRSLALSDSIVRLCQSDHPTEALPVLRQLAESVVSMRWVLAGEEPSMRAGEIFAAFESEGWDGLWNAEKFASRAAEVGVSAKEVKYIAESCVVFVLGNSTGAPWSHIFEENQRFGAKAQDVLRCSVYMMGHCLKALDDKWQGSFPGAETMWESI